VNLGMCKTVAVVWFQDNVNDNTCFVEKGAVIADESKITDELVEL